MLYRSVKSAEYGNWYDPFVVITSLYFPHSWLITGCLKSVARHVSLVEDELLTLPKHMNEAFVAVVLLNVFFFAALFFFLWSLYWLSWWIMLIYSSFYHRLSIPTKRMEYGLLRLFLNPTLYCIVEKNVICNLSIKYV